MPAASRIRAQATPAAPAPEITTRRSARPRPVSVAALRNAASTTIAVPCWSSWKTGIGSSSRNWRSISKQRGAEMSSRLMPPNEGAMCSTVSMICCGSVVSSTIGTEFSPANSANSAHLPSITGSAAAGPMLPRPSTAVPSLTTATSRDRQV